MSFFFPWRRLKYLSLYNGFVHKYINIAAVVVRRDRPLFSEISGQSLASGDWEHMCLRNWLKPRLNSLSACWSAHESQDHFSDSVKAIPVLKFAC